MASPTLVLLQRGWRPIAALPEALRELREVLTEVRRTDLKGVRAVGTIEPHLIVERGQCNVHCHLVIDRSLTQLDLARLGAHVRKLTSREGYAGAHPGHDARIAPDGVARMAYYLAKPDTWCPPVGVWPRHALATLVRSLHCWKGGVDWGRIRAPKTAPTIIQLTRHFFVATEAAETVVRDALDHAREVIERDDPEACLTLVALDYLMSTTQDPGVRFQWIPTLERTLGVQLAAVDAEGRARHGAKLLRDLQQRGDQTRDRR